MFKVIVTTDFSNNSKAGIKFALQLQAQTKCELIFYHVIEIMKPTSWNDRRFKHFAAQKIADKTEELIGFIHKVSDTGSRSTGKIAYKVEIGTDIEEKISKYAKKMKCQFICMATKGAGKIKKIFGTNASAVVNHSATPVIVIPHAYKPSKISTLFYASDFSRLSAELTVLKKFSEELKAKINVFHYDYLLHVQENRNKLEKLAAKYKTKDIGFNFRRLEIDQPLSEHLRKEIIKEKPGLIVLFTKQNLNWFNRLFPSGEAREMAFNTKVPLVVFRKKLKA